MIEGSILADKFRAKMAKEKDTRISGEAEFSVAYSTGFLALDFLNGTVVHVKNDRLDFCYNSVGILDGCANTFIGRSGCGKSTFCLQIAGNIIKKFKTSMIYLDDIEGGNSDARKETATNMTPEELQRRMIVRNTGITTENLYKRLRTIHDLKLAEPELYTYDTGLMDPSGNRLFKLEPTIYILDSIALLMPDNLTEDDELGGQMNATAIAKKNTQLFKAIVPLLKKANIIMLCVNHILDNIDINQFQKKKAQLSYLRQDERLPGGKAALYLANNMIRLDDNSKLKATEGFGIDGSIVDCSILKSRTNKSGKSIPLIFNQATGFDPELSLFQLLKANGKVKGAGAYLYLGDRDDMKFSQKAFKQKLAESPDLQKVFAEQCYQVLVPLLSESIPEVREDNVVDISLMILNMGMNQEIA